MPSASMKLLLILVEGKDDIDEFKHYFKAVNGVDIKKLKDKATLAASLPGPWTLDPGPWKEGHCHNG